MKHPSFPPHAIAVVGIAGRFPGARDLDQFWQNIRDGVEVIDTLSDADLEAAGIDAASRSDPNWVRKATTLEGSCDFDAQFFGISPREAQLIDPQQRVFLECAFEALEDAGWAGQTEGISVGVYAGAGMNWYMLERVAANPEVARSAGAYQIMVANDKDFLCTRVSYKLDLRGPSVSIQTACSTSLVAVVAACRALAHGECDMALAGGVSIAFPERTGYRYDVGMILSPDGHCRPFDADAGGIRPGAGAGVVVLKRLADAVADRDTIHAVIRGAAINNDGSGKAGYTAPSVDGQTEVIATAQALAGVEPRSIAYVEAHGTGTPLGDPIEMAALSTVFRAGTDDEGFCQLGSIKANLGHLDAAAGVAGLIKAILVLKHREFPPLVNFRRANPQIELEKSPFSISTQSSPWRSDGAPRRAGVSSFGIGGTNAHVVLEEAPENEPRVPQTEPRLLILSARTAAALDQSVARLAARLGDSNGVDLGDAAWTLQVGRRHFPHRAAFVARSVATAAADLGKPERARVISGVHEGGERPVAFMFTGQGSQHVGMGAGLYANQHTYRQAVDVCAGLLEPHLGLDIRGVMHTPSGYDINETRLAQPALFVCEYALARLWMSWGVKPAAMIGHSIGEYVAAHLAGVLALEDALALVAARGRIMQQMPPGSMAAVHASRATLNPLIEGLVEIAAVNAPSLCAIAGSKERVAEVLHRLRKAQIETVELKTSHAFHSAMMEPALPEFRKMLDGIKLSPPTVPYISNVTGTWITGAEATSPDYWCRHLRGTVEFAKGIATLAADQTALLLEVGPGAALTSIARMCLPKARQSAAVASLTSPNENADDRAATLKAVGQLWAAGVAIDWQAMNEAEEPRRIPLPTFPFERKRYIVERPAKTPDPATIGRARPAFSQRIDDFFYAPSWQRDEALNGGSAKLDGLWLVLDGGGELSSAIIAQIQSDGGEAVLVVQGEAFERSSARRYCVRLGVPADIAAVISDRAHAEPVSGAIYLWDFHREAVLDAKHVCAVSALAEALQGAKRSSIARIIVATTGAASVLNERIEDSSKGIAVGTTLVLPTEVPHLLVRTVDLETDDLPANAEILLSEAGYAGAEQLVAWRSGRRFVHRYHPVALGPQEPSNAPLKKRGAYLITGGLGGIGLAIAKWLASTCSARLLLTGRSPLPPRAEWDDWLAKHPPRERNACAIAAIREIEQIGGEVLIHVTDAADEDGMKAALDEARRRWGAIDGIVHCAGIKGVGRPAVLTDAEDISRVLAPKLAGLDVLVRLLGNSPVDFVALMSSISSVVGYPANVDYAAANAVLDAFVESQIRPAAWRYVVSINWDSWREVGMAAGFELENARMAASDAYQRASISPNSGIEALGRILGSKRTRVVVTPMDLLAKFSSEPQELGHRGSALSDDASASTQARHGSEVRKSDENTDVPATSAERTLAEIWTELLGVERVAADDNFFALGGHSLMATRALVRIRERFGVNLVLRDIFDAPTLATLAVRISQAAPSGPHPALDDDREELVF